MQYRVFLIEVSARTRQSTHHSSRHRFRIAGISWEVRIHQGLGPALPSAPRDHHSLFHHLAHIVHLSIASPRSFCLRAPSRPCCAAVQSVAIRIAFATPIWASTNNILQHGESHLHSLRCAAEDHPGDTVRHVVAGGGQEYECGTYLIP